MLHIKNKKTNKQTNKLLMERSVLENNHVSIKKQPTTDSRQIYIYIYITYSRITPNETQITIK